MSARRLKLFPPSHKTYANSSFTVPRFHFFGDMKLIHTSAKCVKKSPYGLLGKQCNAQGIVGLMKMRFN